MPYGNREHRLGCGAHGLIHRSGIGTAVRTWLPTVLVSS
jgi:hypothetical protein